MKKLLCVMFILILLFSLIACEAIDQYPKNDSDVSNSENNSEKPDESQNPSLGGNNDVEVEPNTQLKTLSSFGTNSITSTPSPEVIEDTPLWTVYQYKMGALSDIPIFYGLSIEFSGVAISISLSEEYIIEESIESSFERCVSEMEGSIETNTVGVGVECSYYSGNCSNEIGSEKNKSIAVSSIQKNAQTYTKSSGVNLKYTLDENKCKFGYKYRLILTSAFDIYYIVKYDKVNDKLSNYYYMDEIEGEHNLAMEECKKEKLWKDNLDKIEYPSVDPISDGIKNSEIAKLETTISKTRAEEYVITDNGRWTNPFDKFDIEKMFGVSAKKLKEAGYNEILIKLSIEIKEEDDGYQYIFINNKTTESSDDLISWKIEHYHDKLDSTWWEHTTDGRSNKGNGLDCVIDLGYFNNDDIYIRYGASGNGGDTWKNRNLKVTFTLIK